MRKAIMIFILLAAKANAAQLWGLCPGPPVTGMIPCDTKCFGPAGLALGEAFVADESMFQNQISENIQKWVDANNTHLEYQQAYFQANYYSNSTRATALDGLAKTVSLSIEKLAKEREKSANHFIESYAELKRVSRAQVLAVKNAKDYKPPYTSPTGEHLLKEIEGYATSNKELESLKAILVPMEDGNYYLNTNEKAALFVKADKNESDRENINNFARYLTKDVINNDEWEVTLKALTILFAYNPDSFGQDDEIENGNGLRLLKKLTAVRNKYALNALVETLTLTESEEDGITSYAASVREINIANDLSGKNKMLLPHGLKSEILFQKALENKLLNNYMTQAKSKNALKVIAGL